MNPDVVLASIRDAILDYQSAPDTDEAIEAADRALSTFASLDAWLRTGGHLPQRWAR